MYVKQKILIFYIKKPIYEKNVSAKKKTLRF